MRELGWIDRDVPDDLRMALGDLVIVAAGVEASACAIARIYRVPDPQLQSAKRIVGRIEARAGDLGIPPWSENKRRELLAWCHAARLLLAERDMLIHASISVGQQRADGKRVTYRWSLRDGQPIDSEAHHIERLVRLLMRVRHAGILIDYGLGYPWPSGGRMPPDYVTFGRLVVPTREAPQEWRDWADRAAANG